MEKKKTSGEGFRLRFTKLENNFILGQKEPVQECLTPFPVLALLQKGHLLRMPDVERFSRLIAREPNVDLIKMQKECIFSGKKSFLALLASWRITRL